MHLPLQVERLGVGTRERACCSLAGVQGSLSLNAVTSCAYNEGSPTYSDQPGLARDPKLQPMQPGLERYTLFHLATWQPMDTAADPHSTPPAPHHCAAALSDVPSPTCCAGSQEVNGQGCGV